MTERILIVGGVAGGATAAARLRRLDEDLEIIIFERGKHVSFANCGLPYYVGEEIEKKDDLIIQTPESLEERFNVEVRTENKVTDIDTENKEVEVEDLKNNETYSEKYDKLVLSPGAEPVKPPIDGIEQVDNLFTVRSIPDSESIRKLIDSENISDAVVVGGGFIGLEMTENLKKIGLNVSLVEMMEQVMPPLDYDLATKIHNHLREKDINLHLEDGVKAFEKEEGRSKVILESDKEIEADLIILAIGVRPETDLAEKANLEIGETGGVKVNEFLETSEPDIYAIGDIAEIEHKLDGSPANIALAGPASKQGRIVANNIAGEKEKYDGVQGTFITKVFDLTIASTGMNEKVLNKKGIDYEKSFTTSKSHVDYYPGAKRMNIKLMFDPDSGELYGAQIVGKEGVDKRIDVLASAIRFGKDVFDLQELELAYAPPFSAAKDPVNMAGYVAGNIINDKMDIIHWHDLDPQENDDTVILDVRDKQAREDGYIENSINIPLSELRDQLNELPRNQKIVTYCEIGLRSYIANRILTQNGYDSANLSGGYNIYNSIQRDKQNN
uniref:Pyridine nucleotide-disulfide oxidoreductase family protein n=1 Tax=uncultured organism TaxID=155900 RepID=M1PQG8_9ZZZZ|nr:pyridine nucleotide-disulfide oxidoreductase family protein [uncultured organism]